MAEIVDTNPLEPSLRALSTSGSTAKSRCQDAPGEPVDIDVGGSLALPGKDIEPLGDRPGKIQIRSKSFADADLSEIAAPPLRVTQASGDPFRYHVIFLFEGYGTHRCAGGAFTQTPGDIVLLDTTKPCQVVSPVNARLVRWSLPEELLAPYLPAQDAILHLPAREGLISVLSRHAQELAREAERLDGGAQRGLLTHLCGLLGLAIEAETTSTSPTRRYNYRACQRQRVLNYIEAHLCDCRLTAKRAAKDLGISPRWLHALLEDIGGFHHIVVRHRLKKCLGHLENPDSNLSIAEVAFLSGFNDLSTFYRRFGERYGTTPGEVRRARTRLPEVAKRFLQGTQVT